MGAIKVYITELKTKNKWGEGEREGVEGRGEK
jgi:hypothetical protein